MSVNKVILIGNIGADPEVRYLDSNKVVANMRLATTEGYKDKEGNRVTQTEWHNLEMWDDLAKIAEKYIRKGKEIYVEGKIKTDTWQDKEGNNRYTTKIRVTSLTLLRGGNENQSADHGKNQTNPSENISSSPNPAKENAVEDDLPF
jgi:single-strand DNA-binding protein